MNIVFLDFDGVLTTPESQNKFDPRLFEVLSPLIEIENTFIVITSSWRCITKDDTIKNIIDPENRCVGHNPFPFTDKIIDVTPRCGAWMRGQEVETWFKMHIEQPEIATARYVILDDMDDYFDEQKKHLVRTNAHLGITPQNVKTAIDILRR